MSDDALSKRARQKQRREERLARERQQAAKGRRNRLMAYAGLGVLAALIVGYFVQGQLAERAERREQARLAAENQEKFGCTADEEQADLGQGHLETDAESLAAALPQFLYNDRPGSSGRHLPSWVKTGVYDKVIDERLLVHNLEHGYVLAYYTKDAPAEQVEALKADGRAAIDDDLKKLVVAEWDSELPDGAQFAYVAWGRRQLCEQYDSNIMLTFARAHMGLRGKAPEASLQPHLSAGGGTIDPDASDGPLLFPPLGENSASGGMTESGATEGATGDSGATETATPEGEATEPEATPTST